MHVFLQVNPRHPLIKELLRRVEDNPSDTVAKNMAIMMFNTATLRYITSPQLHYVPSVTLRLPPPPLLLTPPPPPVLRIRNV
jgi:hypothetical protein